MALDRLILRLIELILSVVLNLAIEIPNVETESSVVESQALSTALSVETLYELLAASSWPEELWPTVTRIIECESSRRTDAVNGVHYGLLQVNHLLWGPVPDDPLGQLQQGWFVYQTQGWTAWECYYAI